MKFLIKKITEKTMEYKDKVICESIENNGDNIKFIDDINFDGTLKKGMDFVEISGEVTAEFVTNCHYCGGDAKYELKFDIFETYRREPGEDEYYLIGDEVDFDDMILENVRLNLPLKILCKDDCKGVCSICGKDLNKETCNCLENVEKESPFEELKKLIKN